MILSDHSSTAGRSKWTRLGAQPARRWRLAWWVMLPGLACGCASTPAGSSAPRPGRGIAEYREVAKEAHGSVAAVVTAMEAFQKPFMPSSPSPALARFDRAFHQLELTSVKTRSRAEAIIGRGEAYFEEWKENLSGMTNRATAQEETDRYTRMREHFEKVRQCSGEVRTEFGPFMSKLREVRARLEQPARVSPDDMGKELEELKGGGRRVLQALESVLTALNDAESAVRAAAKTP